MNILGFNPLHHSSDCLLQNGKIKHFIQEERINKRKYDAFPFRSLIDYFQNYKIDIITWGAPSVEFLLSSVAPLKSSPYWYKLGISYNPNLKLKDYSSEHHLCHAAHSFYNSGFDEAIGIVIDGMGSLYKKNNYRETESIFYCSYPSKFKTLYKNIINVKEKLNLSRVYETITMYLGWDRDEAGKTMGLASYGKYNSSFPSFFSNKIGNSNVFFIDYSKPSQWLEQEGVIQQTFFDDVKNPQLKLTKNPKEWHYNKSKITDLEKDLAWRVQNDTQQIVGDYIEKSIKKTGLKKICCSGGYFLNCVANYYLTKRFPDVEFYFEPIANDAGTAIGAAKLVWHTITKDTTIRPFKSLYLGSRYSKQELLKGIKKYVDN